MSSLHTNIARSRRGNMLHLTSGQFSVVFVCFFGGPLEDELFTGRCISALVSRYHSREIIRSDPVSTPVLSADPAK